MTTSRRDRPSPHEIARTIPLGDLLSLGVQINADVTPELLFREVSEAITHVLGFRHVHIRLRNVETDDLEVVAWAGLSEEEQASLRAHAIAPGDYQALLQERFRIGTAYFLPASAGVMVEPALARPAPPTAGARTSQWQSGDYLLVPLRGRGDRLLGIIYLSAPADRTLPGTMTLAMLEAIARQAALSLENARLYARTARLLTKEQLLVELGREISTSLDLPTILQRAAARLATAFPGGSIALIDEHAGLKSLITFGSIALPDTLLCSDVERVIGERVIARGVSYLSNDLCADEPLAAEYATHLSDTAPRSYIAVPLRSGGPVIGVLTAFHSSANRFTYEDVDLLEAVAGQIGGPIASARLHQEVERRSSQLAALNEVGRQIAATLDLDELLWQVVRLIRDHFGYQHVTLGLSEGQQTGFKAHLHASTDIHRSLDGRLYIDKESIMNWVVSMGEPLLVHDVTVDPRLTRPDALPLLGSELCVPLRHGNEVIGALDVQSEQVAAFDNGDLAVLQALADQVAAAIINARLYQQERRRADQLTVLNAVARTAAATLDLERLISEVTGEIQHGFGYDNVQLYLLDDENNHLTLAAHAGEWQRDESDVSIAFSVHNGLIGRAARSGTTVRVDDVYSDQDYVVINETTRSELCVPVKAAGRVLAVLNLESTRTAAFTEDDVAVLETAADVLAGAIENARLYRRAQEAAVLEERARLARDLHDSVTQQLFSIALTAQAVRAHLEKRPDRATAQIERLQETAAAALAEMRGLIFQLRPPAALERGLIPALQQHIAAVRRRDGLPIELRIEGDGRLPHRAEQGLYRIAQEALNNVARHAGECYVVVTVSIDQQRVYLEIEDSGRGFNHEELALLRGDESSGRRLGLTSMRERAVELGANLRIESRPYQGTRVIVELPRS